jgi:transcriptional regulator with XRE-family HTH domain
MARKKKILTEDTLLVAYNIKEARGKKYDTINAAAVSLKVEKSLWRQWENALVTPQRSMLQRVAKHLEVDVAYFQQKTDDWDTVKAEFLQELIGRTKVNKEYYLPLHHAFKEAARNPGDDGQAAPPEDRRGDSELLGIFLQIARLIADARSKAHEVDQETYDTHMRTIADIAKLSLLAKGRMK